MSKVKDLGRKVKGDFALFPLWLMSDEYAKPRDGMVGERSEPYIC